MKETQEKYLLILNQFASTPEYSSGAGERYYYLAPYFQTQGFDVSIVSGSYNHLFKRFPKADKLFNEEEIKGGRFIWVRLKKYKGESFLGRIYSWFEFAIKLFFLKQKTTPNIVLVSSMSIFPIFYAFYLKRRYKSKVILEVRDIWPLTPVELGGISKKHPFILLLNWVEKYAYKNSDRLISVLPGFGKHVKNVLGKEKEVTWIPNAISESDGEIIEQVDFLNKDYFNVIYTGAMGIANSLNDLIEAAIFLKEYSKIRINLIGDGPEKTALEQRVRELSLSNVLFFEKVGKSKVQAILKASDLCFIAWKNRDIYKFGVSANKYNDYMLASKPILSASNIENDPVLLANSGIQVEPENPRAIAEAILEIFQMEESKRNRLGLNGREFLLNNQTYNRISTKFQDLLNDL